MSAPAVSWRRVALVLGAVALCATATVAALRSDGYTAVDATVPRATRWFVNESNTWAVLADGFAGKALARVSVGAPGDVLEIAQSASRAAVVDRTSGTVQPIDWASLKVGSAQPLGLDTGAATLVGAGQPGLVAVDVASGEAVLVPPDGDPLRFPVGDLAGIDSTRIAPDGAVWTLRGDRFWRITSSSDDVYADGVGDGRITLVGNTGMVFDAAAMRVRLGAGSWVDLPDGLEPSEVVLQQNGPTASCGWLASGDDLWCVSGSGVERTVRVPGLAAGGADWLAIAGDAAALVDRPTNAIVRFDWRAGKVIDDEAAFVSPGRDLVVATATDLVWIDEAGGNLVWAITPWGINTIRKNDTSTPLLGESGEVLEQGTGGTTGDRVDPDEVVMVEREPDDNGVDDPPQAFDDPVTARTGAAVAIPVTANDFDPDGEAVALIAVGRAAHGTVDPASATTAVYQPESGYVGTDEFEYTITDAAGHTDTARVQLTLLAVDAPNSAPIGRPDRAETGPDASVVIDVLLNDVDPERDALRLGSFTPPDIGGEVYAAQSPSGLPALQYVPPLNVSGTATFTYRPMDALGAQGDPVVVTVEIAQPGDANRPPVVQPDAVRVRTDSTVTLPVLANDRDPDGDRMTVGVLEPLPPGLDVRVVGADLAVTARAGAQERLRFGYVVTDTVGNKTVGSVLVIVVGADEPNRSPIATADTATAVVGNPVSIDVLRNDSDPDNDPLVLVAAEPNATSTSAGAVRIHDDRVLYTPAPLRSEDSVDDRFTYRISDGHGHEAVGTVTVRVLADPIVAPPFARDDSATTTRNVPVTIDVLRNDSDPSGGQPTLVGTPGCAGGGTARRTDDNRVRFTPPPNATGVYRCTYEVVNDQQIPASASIVISVLQPPADNADPVVAGEEVTIRVGETRTIDVLSNDTDPDGDELRVLSSSAPSVGTASRVGGRITYAAPPSINTVGPTIATIEYRVGDGGNGLATGNLVFRVVEPEPMAPIAVADRLAIYGPAIPVEHDVVSNDSDPDGERAQLEVQSAVLAFGPPGVSVSKGATVLRVSAPPDYVGDVVVDYTIVDADGLTASSSFTLTVREPLNRAPIAQPDSEEVVNGGTVVVPIGLNDSDPDGDPLTYEITRPPDSALGTATLSGSMLTFVSRAGAPSGVADIGYRVSDGELTADSNVRIAVQACAVAPPSAPNLFFETGYQTPIAIDLTQHARNGTIFEVGAPLNGPSAVYTPPAGENGNVTFGYAVRNSCGVVARGTVTVDVNQPPVAGAVALKIGRFEQVALPVSSLASDDEALTISDVPGQPAWVSITGGGQGLSLAPNGATGTVAFTVVVTDPGGLTASVPVTVELTNRAPVGQPDTVRLPNGPADVNVLANDTDPDGDTISISAFPTQLTFPNGATGSVEAVGGVLRVTPGAGAGSVVFEYSITDPYGAVSAPIQVTVVVNGAPTASDVSVDVPWLAQATVAMPVSDPDGDALRFRFDNVPAGLQVEASGNSVTVTNVAALGSGPYDIPYTVTDPDGRSASAVLRVVVAPQPSTTTTTVVPTTTTTVAPTTTTIPPTSTTTTEVAPTTAPTGSNPPGQPAPPSG